MHVAVWGMPHVFAALVLGQLWQAGIRADASLSESANLRGHLEEAQASGAQHIVLVRHAGRASKVTIKQLQKHGGRGYRKTQAEEEQVPLADVAKFFVNRKGGRSTRGEASDARRA